MILQNVKGMPVANFSFSNVTEDTAEAQYQALYAACTAGEIDAVAAIKHIDDLFQHSKSQVIKSYCLLFYGAVVDAGALDACTLSHLSQQLSAFLDRLTDYRVKDSNGHYVHFLSHATYLAQSLHDLGAKIGWKPLLAAYLRNDEAYGWNEEIVLAECLLGMVVASDFPAFLAQLHAGDDEGPSASNKRALWMAMKVFNERTPRVEDAVFNGLVEEMAEMVE